uniref:DUF6824 domain-containing protein n=1 Tax=Odontella aurita TaxID=265563 RepID=A0A7S4IJQ1_9STRA|mmetsp:Transcript_26074/g.77192  ORF Transcript_26074/g.77192 Transcript_26074/m.77192 type:complete len:183 (+) Transcript_26074:190-738(+)|eukprot:CAMPEP_0113530348 /NCGR_PEP_ID=MMETSP0015_2-20120614/2889_1 /TAXON_ID=2838 /ORGANISM="Odontella" /LENGTH=182 /DNA_ID=CAMNT_0000429059 /DNA_START=187 /DNA_END=735 /DNA_ORIENTATION=- /assembly_acc=CAM_ASM_000160
MSELVPTPMDVICGRGKKSKDHAGNARFHYTIRKYKDEYRTATTKDEKTRISLSVLQELRSSSPSGEGPSRFLKLTGDEKWVDIGDSAAREKISQALREAIAQRPPQVRPKRVTRKVDKSKVEYLLSAQKALYITLCEKEGLDADDSDSGTDESSNGFYDTPNTKKRRSPSPEVHLEGSSSM